jgi:hypothetical protein
VTRLPDVRRQAARHGAEGSVLDLLSFPIAWAETGRFGTLLIPSEDWRGRAYAYHAAGAPDGAASTHTWVYVWNGSFFEPHMRIDPHRPTVWGSLARTAWWAWLPSVFAAVIFHAFTTAGTKPITDSQFLTMFVPTMCLFWALVHRVRWLGRRPK